MSSEIMDLARKAHETYDFYKWFYGKHKVDFSSATYDDLPVLTKLDLLEFDASVPERRSMPYLFDCGQVVPLYDFFTILYTSGTTGRAIRVLWTMDEFLDLNVKPFSTQVPMWLGEERPIIVCPGPTGPPTSIVLEHVSDGQEIIIPGDKIFDNHYLHEAIRKGKGNLLFDLTGSWTKHLVDSGFPLYELGIKLIGTMGAISDDTARRLKDVYGSNVVAYSYGSIETLTLAFSCPQSTRLHLHENVDGRRRFIHVVDENNEVKEIGTGRIIITMGRKALPWIKYSNGDNVTLEHGECECGFKGRFVTNIARSVELKIGGLAGPIINPSEAERYLQRTFPAANYLMVYVKGGLKKESVQPLFATFLESGVSEPVLDREASIAFLTGSGVPVADTFLDFSPFIKVPAGVIPLDFLTRQRKRFLNLIQNPVPDELRPLLNILTRFGYTFES